MRPLAGDPPSDQGAGCEPRDVVALAWGVVRYVSSISSSMRSSSELEDESDGMIPGALPNEPERLIFSWLPMTDQSELDDCSVLLKSPLRRPGMFMPRPPAVGLESGLGWSARVEWCRLVAAREKSSPLERRGRTFVGEAKTCEWSSLGLRGPTRLLANGLPTEDWAGEKSRLCGRCRLREPREEASRRGVDGAAAGIVVGESVVSLSELSSFVLRVAAIMWGDGESLAAADGSPSESERGLGKGERGIRSGFGSAVCRLMSSSSTKAESKRRSLGWRSIIRLRCAQDKAETKPGPRRGV